MTMIAAYTAKSAQELSETVSISNRIIVVKVHQPHTWRKIKKAKDLMLSWAETAKCIQQNDGKYKFTIKLGSKSFNFTLMVPV